MIVKVNGKKYQLKFGFGAIRIICEKHGYTKISGFDELLKKYNLGEMEDPTFEQLGFIGDIVVAGIKNVDKKAELTSDDVLDSLMATPEKFTEIFNLFAKSLPQQNAKPAGK